MRLRLVLVRAKEVGEVFAIRVVGQLRGGLEDLLLGVVDVLHRVDEELLEGCDSHGKGAV